MTSDRFQRPKFVPALMLGMALSAAYALPAVADDTDPPLQIETGHWMSLDRYTDNIQKNRPLGNEVLENKPKIESPSLEPAPGDQAQKAATTQSDSASSAADDDSQPKVARPTRPLDLPLLPGVNKGYGLAINSTMDQPTAPAQIVQDDKGKTDMQVPEHNWQDAAESARQFKPGNTTALNDAEHNGIDIRYSFLPNTHVVPVFARAYTPRTRFADVPVTSKPAVAEVAKTAGPAECAAIDAYKKKQLEAIQSDRQTLQALQAAIVDLGLQKQLDFMSGAQQSPTLSTTVSAPNPFASTPTPATATP